MISAGTTTFHNEGSKVIWRPQEGPQHALCDCPLPEVFFGGARGGGKTDGVLGKWALKERRYGPKFNAIMFRRTTVSSADAIERSREIYEPLGATLAGMRWRMPNGGRVSFAYLDSVEDAQEYQGRNVTDAWVEEAGQYPTSAPILRLFGVLRSAHGVPIQLVLTANPGGPGQQWLRERYELMPFPRFPRRLFRPLPDGTVHQVAVIPSRIDNNQILLRRDPGYKGRLYLVGSAALVKAWIEGDWTAIEGAYFDCWSQRNIIEPFLIPDEWTRFRSGDWGSYSPFSFGWWAVCGDDMRRNGQLIPRGAMVRYREWYGSTDPRSGEAKGLKLFGFEAGRRMAIMESGDPKLAYGVLDPSTFKQDGGPPIAEEINRALGLKGLAAFHAADNTRVNQLDGRDRRGPMSGWDQMRGRMVGRGKVPNNVPMLFCFSTCVASIRTIPILQHDPVKAEDLDTQSEDHAADDWRYACSSRPWVRVIEEPETPADGYVLPKDDMRDAESSVKLL